MNSNHLLFALLLLIGSLVGLIGLSAMTEGLVHILSGFAVIALLLRFVPYGLR